MSITENILRIQLEKHIFDNEEQMVRGIAQRAVNQGFDSLSDHQKNVLEPFLTQHCGGITDPVGDHNYCSRTLTGDNLLEAYELCYDPDGLECGSCRSERGGFDHDRANRLNE